MKHSVHHAFRRGSAGLLVGVLGLVLAPEARAEELEITATAVTNPVSLVLRIQGYNNTLPMILYRRTATGSYGAWTNILSTNVPAPAGVATYTDTTVVAGTVYEYRADRSDYSGNGYGVGAVEASARDARGRLLLMVEDTLLAPLSNEIRRLEVDLVCDGWQVLRASAPRYNPALSNAARVAHLATVRDAVSNAYAAAGSLEAVYLLGHVPVPYSIASQYGSPFWGAPPDGHDTHVGCWPTDQYYADCTGASWTDGLYTVTNATMPRCSTYPGDGKFDNFTAPSPLEVQVGRVDLSDLPAFALSETELVRRYLDKAHHYRRGQLPFARRAAVTDDLTPVRRTFPNLLGPGSYGVTNMRAAFQETEGFYLTSANGAGSFTSVGSHYTTQDLATNQARVFLQLALGSYFGDWDATNVLLRATLGGANGGLASLWFLFFADSHSVSLPHVDIAWSLNHMALGAGLGDGVRFTQNRVFDGGPRQSMVYSLMGDPSLRLFPVAPPALLVASNLGASVALSWQASPAPDLVGYHIYLSTNNLSGPFSRITGEPVAGTAWTATNVLSSTATFQVRAVKREVAGAGTFYNTSQGVLAQASSGTTPRVTLTVEPGEVQEGGDTVVLRVARTGAVTGELAVAFTRSGTVDTNDLIGDLTSPFIIPAGEVQAERMLAVVDDQRLEGREELTLNLVTNAGVQAGLFDQAWLVIQDNDEMPATPAGLTALEEGGAVRVNWTDLSSNETAFVLERRDLSAGGTLLMDNENTNFATRAPASALWFLQPFTNAYGGNCRAMKQSGTATNYVDYRPGLSASGTYDIDLWYPSGSVGGTYVSAQTALVVRVGVTNVVVFYPRTNGASWYNLGRFNLDTGTVIRLQSASSGSEYSVADVVRLSAPFVVWTQLAANVTTWLDEAVSHPGAYEYRVRAALENTASVASAQAVVGLGGGLFNRPPYADAGTNQFGYFPLTNQLNGSASDPDDRPAPVLASWRQISGPAEAVIANTNLYNTTVIFPTSGVYVLGLEASDGVTSTLDTVTHTVAPTLVPTSSTQGVEFVLDTNTLALWHFNGNALDATTNGYHLTLSNGCSIVTGGTATAWMASPAGAALRVLNYPHLASCLIPDSALLNRTNQSPFTLEARIFLDAWGSNTASYRMLGVWQNSDTQFTFEQANGGSPFGKVLGNSGAQLVNEVEMGGLMNTGAWHHLMLVFDGSNVWRAVLDGSVVGVAVTNSPNWGRTSDFQLSLGNLNGYIDEARLSRIARYVPPVANTNPPVASDLGPGSLAPPAAGGFQVGFATVTGQVYGVEFVTSLFTNDWQILSNGITGTGGSLVIADPSADSNRYYRIRAWRP